MSIHLLTIEQVAERFGVKPRFVRSLISKNEIEYIRVGARQIKFTEVALQDYLVKKTVPVRQTAIDDSKYSSLKLAIKRNCSLKSKDETVKGDYSAGLSKELRDSWR
ncbi:MAG: excisionase family DNA-binding protein [Desulfomonilaceae bacterium]